jgi:hypothetical protein
MLDVDGELLIDDVLIHRGAVDHTGDCDELFTSGVRSRAHAGDQQVALHPVRPGAATAHDPGCRQRDQRPDEHDDDHDLQHTVMVGLLA